jgi:multicomponent K+:H+ antiporter subunit E
MRKTQPTIKKPLKAVRYLFMLMGDIIVSNIEVAIQVLGPLRRISPGFIAVPLDLTQDLPITLLASSISLTPGTVSLEVSEDKQWLYVHVLNLTDEAATIANIKQRYEQPLKEIFGC